jgi:hypothetical protein
MLVMLRLKSRYLMDGAAIGSAEFLRRLTGKATVSGQAPEGSGSESGELAASTEQTGRPGVPSSPASVARQADCKLSGNQVIDERRVLIFDF